LFARGNCSVVHEEAGVDTAVAHGVVPAGLAMLLVTGGALEARIPALSVEEQFVCIQLVNDVLLLLVSVGLNHVAADILVVWRVLHVLKLHSNCAAVTTFGIIDLEGVFDTNQTILCSDFAVVWSSVLLGGNYIALCAVTIKES